jgi:cytoskeletal protein CcmA (bactofilin family)
MLGRRKRIKSNRVTTLIDGQTELIGDIRFSGGLAIMGEIRGNVLAQDGSDSVVDLHQSGRVEGEIRAPNVIVNGIVLGDVYATEHLQLAENARVNGNVYYHLIQMEMGAEVNGSLVHIDDPVDVGLKLGHEPEPAVSPALALDNDAKDSKPTDS